MKPVLVNGNRFIEKYDFARVNIYSCRTGFLLSVD
jgi:hypothetical protein